MGILKIKNKKFIDLHNLDIKFFSLGIFFLASAPFISCALLLYPLFKGLFQKRKNLLKDGFNQLLMIISLILITKTITTSLLANTEIPLWDSSLNWAGISNLIPMFLCYMAFNEYLDEGYKRKKVIKLFVAGTFPVLATCIGQYWFNWYGPFEIFNGLIKWFQRPLIDTDYAVSGLFNNQNYTAIWLTMMWPLILILLKEKFHLKEFLKSKILLVITIFNAIFIVLTNSRNGLIGLLIPFIFLIGPRFRKFVLLFTSGFVILIILLNLSFISIEIKELSRFLIPGNLENRFNATYIDFFSYPRIKIWLNAIYLIFEKPLFGWGANSFPYLYESKTGILNFHAHNLFLELSVSFGLIVSCLFFLVIIIIFIRSFNAIFNKKKNSFVHKGWWLSGFIFFVSHLSDVLIFDIRINLASWIILIGLRNTFRAKDNLISDNLS